MQVRVDLSDELLMLDEFLCSEAVSDESMLLSEVDGFFAGLNFYATPVEPDEWLPWVWNGETPHFEDEAQAEAVTRALLGLHDDVFRRLERGEWGPIFDTDLDESAVWEVWIDGFWRAAELRPGLWMELVPEDDEEAGIALFSLSRLHELATSTFDEIEPLEIDDELEESASNLIPYSVLRLHHACQQADPFAAGRWKPAVPRKVGRNEPCPCGSGKKYKKCCGGA